MLHQVFVRKGLFIMRRIYLSLLALCLAFSPAYAEDDVVARVNGAIIRAKDLESGVEALISRATYHGTITDATRNEFREKALKELINAELQYQEALARGMKPDEKKARAGLDAIRGRFKSKEDYEKQIAKEGLTDRIVMSRIERLLLVAQALDNAVVQPSRMSVGALKKHYAKNIEKFKQPESLRPRVISMKDEKKAKEALALLEAGADFGDIAATRSEDNYRIMGGDMGFIHRGRVKQELEDVVFRMKEGERSGLIQAADTWFIVKVEEKRPERQLPFDEIKDQLKKDLEKKGAEERLTQWMDGLRQKAKIEVLWKPAGTGQPDEKTTDKK